MRFHSGELEDGDAEIVQKLEEQIDICIGGFRDCKVCAYAVCNNERLKAAFVRLSTLSPKDATLLQSTKLYNIMKEQLKGVSICRESKNCPNKTR